MRWGGWGGGGNGGKNSRGKLEDGKKVGQIGRGFAREKSAGGLAGKVGAGWRRL